MAKSSEIFVGAVFNRLTVTSGVIRKPYVRKSGERTSKLWVRVRCSCGSPEKEVEITALGTLVQSCGCLRLEKVRAANTKHGFNGTLTYNSWCALKQRIMYAKHTEYENYGGRGLDIGKDFLGEGGFAAFLAEVGERPGKEFSIERRDNSKGYVKGNLKWATHKEQSRNRRNTIFISLGGAKTALPDACEALGLPYQRVYDRLKVLNWPVSKALETNLATEWKENDNHSQSN